MMIKIPSWLDEEAERFWKRHKRQCEENGSLTEETADAFAALCRLWSVWLRCDPDEDSKAAMKFSALLKYLHSYGKPFGLFGGKPPVKKQGKDLGTMIADALAKGDDA